LHVIEGTDRAAVRRQRASEPQFERGAPPMPASVAADPIAARHWAHYAAKLTEAGVLTVNHGPALTVLVHIAAAFDRVVAEMAAGHHVQTVTVAGRVRENPLNQRFERLGEKYLRALAEFGQTPVTQSRVSGKTPGPVDPFEQFLGGERPK
jgi:phage terminase small subunit